MAQRGELQNAQPQRTTHFATHNRTTQTAQRTTHIAFHRTKPANCKIGSAKARRLSAAFSCALLVVGAFFAIGGGQELAADDNADAIIRDGIIHSANGVATLPISAININPGCFSLCDGVLARQAYRNSG